MKRRLHVAAVVAALALSTAAAAAARGLRTVLEAMEPPRVEPCHHCWLRLEDNDSRLVLAINGDEYDLHLDCLGDFVMEHWGPEIVRALREELTAHVEEQRRG